MDVELMDGQQIGEGVAEPEKLPAAGKVVPGMPVDPDVKRLLELWPVEKFETDMLLRREDISATIGSKIESHRYRTVVSRWKAYLRKRGVRLAAINKVGYQVCGPQRIIDFGHSALKQTNRMLSGHMLDLSLAKPQTTHHKTLIEHQRLVIGQVLAHSSRTVEKLTISTVPQSLPRIDPTWFDRQNDEEET